MNEVLDNLYWIEELLPPGIESAPKHGGMAYYRDMKLILILVEKRDGGYEHKGVTYPFAIWNGCIIPVEYKKQNAFFLKFSFLENHPANRDWLYIPADTENFEEEVRQFLREIHRENPLLGTPVKGKAMSKEQDSQKRPVKKKTGKVKADKKRENAFLLGVMGKAKK